jgi:DNA invertase Pin-like site-specific DNA recombinase
MSAPQRAVPPLASLLGPIRATRNAIGYVRVSTAEQSQHGVSLDAQEERIRQYCAFHRLELLRICRDEGVSASKRLSERPCGAALARAVGASEVQHVIALKLDRLFRDAVDCLGTATAWDQAGVALHLIDLGGQALDTSSAMGRFFLTVMAGAAELERGLIRERTSTALQHKKANGTKLGMPPLGFTKRTPDSGRDVIVSELAAVRLILRRRRNRASFRRIAAELQAAGYTTKRGGAWHASTVRAIWARRREYEAWLKEAA